VRRFTLITIIVLFVALGIAAYLQWQAGHRPGRFCGPGVPGCLRSPTPSP